MQDKGYIMKMVLGIVGIVVWCTLFSTIFTAIGTLIGKSWVTNATAFSTIAGISPTVLFVAGIFAGGYLGVYKGYNDATVADSSGFVRMAIGALIIILFVTLFDTIGTNINTIWANAGGANLTTYPALRTVTGIAPTVLYVGGLFTGAGIALGGYRSRRRGRRALA